MSPSILARTGASARELATAANVVRMQMKPPFTGYVPGLNAQALGRNAIADIANFVPKGEILTFDDGWVKYQHATLNPVPLGGVGWAFPGTAGSPVQALVYLPAQPSSVFEGIIAITADNGVTDGTVFEFAINGAGKWVECTAGGSTIPTGGEVVIDEAYYPLCSSASRLGIVVFCNGALSGGSGYVWYYPSAGSAYNTFTMPTATPNCTNFKATSVACAHERLFFLNTNENASAHPQRLRWSRVGWTSVAASNWDTTNAGAGAADLTYFKGAGVKVLGIGDRLACYMEDGVAILDWTGNVSAPFTISYATRNRGLLGTRAVCSIGGGLHFGVFDDGFFIFSENGEWSECGVETTRGSRIRKFFDKFNSLASRKNTNRIVTCYDPVNNWVRISFPDTTALVTGTPNQEWIYEIGADRMWPQISTITGLSGGSQRYPTAMAYVRNVAGTDFQMIHGTSTGYVYGHSSATAQRDGTYPAWTLSTIYDDTEDPYSYKTFLGHHIDFKDHAVSGSFTVSSLDGRSASALSNSTQTAFAYTGTTDERRSLWIPAHSTAQSFQHVYTGTHPVSIYGLAQTYTRVGDVL